MSATNWRKKHKSVVFKSVFRVTRRYITPCVSCWQISQVFSPPLFCVSVPSSCLHHTTESSRVILGSRWFWHKEIELRISWMIEVSLVVYDFHLSELGSYNNEVTHSDHSRKLQYRDKTKQTHASYRTCSGKCVIRLNRELTGSP